MKETIIEQVATFRKKVGEFPLRIPQPALTQEQLVELGQKGNDLLTQLVSIASRFLVAEDLDMRAKMGASSMHTTPFLSLSDDESAKFAIFVDGFTPGDFAPGSRPANEHLEQITVDAAIFLKIPELEEPVKILGLNGIALPDGSLQCINVSTVDCYFATDYEKSKKEGYNQLKAITRAKDLADTMGEILKDVEQTVSVEGKAGHILRVNDSRHGEQVFFIRHSQENQ
jgi:hypothetical protein